MVNEPCNCDQSIALRKELAGARRVAVDKAAEAGNLAGQLDAMRMERDAALAEATAARNAFTQLERTRAMDMMDRAYEQNEGAATERAAIVAWVKRNPGTSPNTAWVECAEWIVMQIEAAAHIAPAAPESIDE